MHISSIVWLIALLSACVVSALNFGGAVVFLLCWQIASVLGIQGTDDSLKMICVTILELVCTSLVVGGNWGRVIANWRYITVLALPNIAMTWVGTALSEKLRPEDGSQSPLRPIMGAVFVVFSAFKISLDANVLPRFSPPVPGGGGSGRGKEGEGGRDVAVTASVGDRESEAEGTKSARGGRVIVGGVGGGGEGEARGRGAEGCAGEGVRMGGVWGYGKKVGEVRVEGLRTGGAGAVGVFNCNCTASAGMEGEKEREREFGVSVPHHETVAPLVPACAARQPSSTSCDASACDASDLRPNSPRGNEAAESKAVRPSGNGKHPRETWESHWVIPHSMADDRRFFYATICASCVSGLSSGTVALPGPPFIIFCAFAGIPPGDVRVSMMPLGLISNLRHTFVKSYICSDLIS